jgi:glycosyltransferase involved in cell wall biosynthesis
MGRAKILYITYNGVGEGIFQSQGIPYLKGLSEKGYDITLLSYERDISGSLKHAALLKHSKIAWYRLKYHKKPRILATFYDFLLGMALSFFIALRGKIDIIHARATHGAVIGIPATKTLRKKFIFDTRGLDSEEYADGKLVVKNSLLHKFLFRLEKYLLSESDSVILLSHGAKTLFREKGLDKYLDKKITDVIPCATNLNLFHCAEGRIPKAKNAAKFIYTGSVGTWYMLDEMLNFFMAARRRLINARFSVFTQSDVNAVNRSVRNAKLEPFVEIKTIEYESVPRHILASDIGMCFIKPVSSKRASSPTKIGEYLACGVPVVINSGIGDTEDIIRRNAAGVVIGDFTPAGYNKAIFELEELLENTGLSKRCRLTAERHFSLDDAVNKYDIIYGQLMQQKRAG